MSPGLPEQQARVEIDKALDAAGWVIQDRAELNLSAGPGVAVREFKMADGHGFADYMLFVEGKAVGVLEAKPAGYPGSNSCQAASTNPRNSMFNAGGVPKGSFTLYHAGRRDADRRLSCQWRPQGESHLCGRQNSKEKHRLWRELGQVAL